MPTRSGWMVVAAATACFAAGRALALTELYVLGAVASALVVLGLGSVQRRSIRVEVDRRTSPAVLEVGGSGRAELGVVNAGRRRIGLLTVTDAVEGTVGARLRLGPIEAGQVQRVGYRLPTARRGLLTVGPLRAEVVDAFGLARRKVATLGPSQVLVLPRPDPVPGLGRSLGRPDALVGTTRRSAGGTGREDLASLRPYVVGDDLRRVHWRSSARRDDLVVRHDDEHRQGTTTLIVDTRSRVLSPSELERAISAAAGIVHQVADDEDRLRLVLADGTDTGVLPARRARHDLLGVLALARPTEAEDLPLPPMGGRSSGDLRVILTGGDAVDPAIGLDGGDARRTTVTLAFSDRIEPRREPSDARVVVRSHESAAEAWNRTIGR